MALLYNTFRVLGPVLDSTSQKENQVGFDPSKEYRTLKKSYPTAALKSPTITSLELQPTMHSPLPVHQERSAGVQSSHNHRNPFSGSFELGIDESTLQQSITQPEAIAQKFPSERARSPALQSRQSSNGFVGLTAAPRHTHSNALHDHNAEKMYIIHGAWSMVDIPEQRPASAQTFGKHDSESSCYSCDSAEYDPTNRELRSPDDGHSMMNIVDMSLPVSPTTSLRLFTRPRTIVAPS